MNIYLISQNVNTDSGTYDEAVVVAKSEQDARKIHPSNQYKLTKDKEWIFTAWSIRNPKSYETTCDWCAVSDVTVKLIGTTDLYQEGSIISSSFNV